MHRQRLVTRLCDFAVLFVRMSRRRRSRTQSRPLILEFVLCFFGKLKSFHVYVFRRCVKSLLRPVRSFLDVPTPLPNCGYDLVVRFRRRYGRWLLPETFQACSEPLLPPTGASSRHLSIQLAQAEFRQAQTHTAATRHMHAQAVD